MSLLREALLKKQKKSIKFYRLDEDSESIRIGITKFMDTLAAKYVKDMASMAKENWESISRVEQKEIGSMKNQIERFAMYGDWLDIELKRIEKAFIAAVKRQINQL